MRLVLMLKDKWKTQEKTLQNNFCKVLSNSSSLQELRMIRPSNSKQHLQLFSWRSSTLTTELRRMVSGSFQMTRLFNWEMQLLRLLISMFKPVFFSTEKLILYANVTKKKTIMESYSKIWLPCSRPQKGRQKMQKLMSRENSLPCTTLRFWPNSIFHKR